MDTYDKLQSLHSAEKLRMIKKINTAYNGKTIGNTNVANSVESFCNNAMSTEGIGEVVKKIFDKIKFIISKIIEYIKKFIFWIVEKIKGIFKKKITSQDIAHANKCSDLWDLDVEIDKGKYFEDYDFDELDMLYTMSFGKSMKDEITRDEYLIASNWLQEVLDNSQKLVTTEDKAFYELYKIRTKIYEEHHSDDVDVRQNRDHNKKAYDYTVESYKLKYSVENDSDPDIHKIYIYRQRFITHVTKLRQIKKRIKDTMTTCFNNLQTGKYIKEGVDINGVMLSLLLTKNSNEYQRNVDAVLNIIYDFSCDLTKETYATVEKFVNASNATNQYVDKKILYSDFIKKLSNIKFNSLKQNEINKSISNLIFAFENDVLNEFKVKLDGNIKKLETIRIELDKCLKCFNNFTNSNNNDKRIIDKGGYIQSSFNVLTTLIVKLLETMKSRQQCVMFIADFIDIHKYMK